MPNSKVNGVQFGLTTYSYRSVPHSIDEVLEYVVNAGVNALEMRRVLVEGLGIPPEGSDAVKEVEKCIEYMRNMRNILE